MNFVDQRGIRMRRVRINAASRANAPCRSNTRRGWLAQFDSRCARPGPGTMEFGFDETNATAKKAAYGTFRISTSFAFLRYPVLTAL